jgi:hypothetical protein
MRDVRANQFLELAELEDARQPKKCLERQPLLAAFHARKVCRVDLSPRRDLPEAESVRLTYRTERRDDERLR